jgi:predicted signal transduction protein with EAL and GGDEF domain
MTLFKQIALLVTLLMALLLSTVLGMNFSGTIASVEEQLYEDAQNTATSLSLSLGTAKGDTSIMGTMINANFDSGHYRRIALYDMEENLIYERLPENRSSSIPAWFSDAITIESPVATAQVSAGWSPVGILVVQSDSANAYEQLYATFTGLITLFAILSVVGLALLYTMLKFVLRPLGKVQRQAEAILGNEFIIQQQLPYTTEFRDVVKGMNTMIAKVKDIFEKGNRAMQHNRELLYEDGVSGLFNRRYMVMRLPEFLGDETSFDHGIITLISLHGAQEANRQLGRRKTDEMFAAIGAVLKRHGNGYKEMLAARLNGTEFALLLPGCDDDNGCALAESLCREIDAVLKEYGLDTEPYGVNAGIYRFDRAQSIGDILSGADYALSQANLLPRGETYRHFDRDVDIVMGKEAWREVLSEALEKGRFDLDYWPVCDTRTKTLHHQISTFALYDAQEHRYPYGAFIAPVIQLGMLSRVYLHVIETLFKGADTLSGSTGYAVRLPADLLHTPNLTAELDALLGRYRSKLTRRFIFEIPDPLLGENHELGIQFATLFKRNNLEFGINQFSGASKDYGFLQEFKPAYIKANATYLTDQSPQSMTTLQMLTETIGIELIAESVADTETLDKLTAVGITVIQGPLAEQFV